MQNPPEPHKDISLDLRKELDNLKVDEADENAYDYYIKLIKLLKTMRDPHTLFTPPCTNNFRYVLPFSFTAEPNQDNTNLIIRAIRSNVPGVTDHYLSQQDSVSIEEKIVKRLSMESDQEDGLQDAFDVISQWTEENIAHSKYPAARLNRALSSEFHSRLASLYPYPESLNILVEYDDGDDAHTLKTVKLPWYGIVQKRSITKLDDYCPIHNAPKVMETLEEKEGSFKNLTGRELLLEREMQETRKWLEEILPPNEVHRAPIKQRNTSSAKGANLEYPMSLVINSANVVAYAHRDLGIGYMWIRTFSPSDLKEFGNQVGLALRRLKEEHQVKKLVVDVRGNGGGYVMLGMQTNQFMFPSAFPVYGRYDMLHSDINTELAKLRDYEPEDDKTYFNDPDTHKPLKGDEWYSTTVEKKFKPIEEGGETFTRQYTRQFEMAFYTPAVFEETIKKWEKYPGRNNGTALFAPQDIITVTDGLCGSTCCCFVKHQQEMHTNKFVGLGGNPKFKNAHYDVGAFAGGTVFAASGLQEYAEDPETRKIIDVTKFPPAFVRDTTEQRWTQHEIMSWNYEEKNAGSNQAEDVETGEDLLEFKKNPVDWVHPHYPKPAQDESEEGIQKIIEEIVPYFDRCADWEVLPDAEKCPAPDASSHKVYGHKCVNGKFDNSTCAFAGCANGFYLKGKFGDEKSTCAPVDFSWIPKYVPDPENEHDKEEKERLEREKRVSMAIIGAMFGLMVVIIGITAAVIAVKKLRSKKQNDLYKENAPLLYSDKK
eukprot:MONOS_5476.1-p1 / transcript=MONOS_5476.1 / gene=MONOS_5476 / organism=Monocercomonoides_exilis_PA203 / gene_product=unspecified product / transcript_product=unspecified product / location=Mono_scaffold00160:2386-4689(+) / protein_length=767 / sequence_SO=supercontig / SO=protein_coding / is_pseudo=false